MPALPGPNKKPEEAVNALPNLAEISRLCHIYSPAARPARLTAFSRSQLGRLSLGGAAGWRRPRRASPRPLPRPGPWRASAGGPSPPTDTPPAAAASESPAVSVCRQGGARARQQPPAWCTLTGALVRDTETPARQRWTSSSDACTCGRSSGYLARKVERRSES